ncbi:hypothetical protein [Microbacterium sp. bgisy189]|uniref:hypothetical protein n=1 Tax=Microbacterium sp. bgisy189 TaxID=3413798 RepID=UPI003EBBDBD9
MTMEDGVDELRALRARAYGPDGDIETDAEALARLHPLESERRRAAAPVEPETPDAPVEPIIEAVPASIADQPSDAVPEAAASDAANVDPALAPRQRLRRRTIWLWVASLVVVAIITAMVTTAITAIRPISAATGAVQVASLDPDPTVELPDESWFPRQSTFYSYEGYTIAHPLPNTWGEGDCIMVFRLDSFDGAGGYTGPMHYGCGAGVFFPAARFAIDENAPDQIRETYADGTAISFELDGELLGVFIDESMVEPAEVE